MVHPELRTRDDEIRREIMYAVVMARGVLFPLLMLGEAARWRLVVGLTAAIGGSFFAGCCGGPFSADGSSRGCDSCAEPAASSDPGCASAGTAGTAGKGGTSSGGSGGNAGGSTRAGTGASSGSGGTSE